MRVITDVRFVKNRDALRQNLHIDKQDCSCINQHNGIIAMLLIIQILTNYLLKHSCVVAEYKLTEESRTHTHTCSRHPTLGGSSQRPKLLPSLHFTAPSLNMSKISLFQYHYPYSLSSLFYKSSLFQFWNLH